MSTQKFYRRRAGILLHPTSLPSGVLNTDVERWLDMLDDTGFSVWQVLPLGEPQGGLSPYQCISAFAMNPALIGEYPQVNLNTDGFAVFCNAQEWLDDYVLFKVLKEKFNNAPWFEWPDEYKHRHSHALLISVDEYEKKITKLKWQQFLLFKRWQLIRDYAGKRNILLFGDVPLFIAHDSVDVWAAPERFLLDKSGRMEVVTGVPPDYFSDTGQRWGNPHYDWEFMKSENYAWWLDRIGQHLAMFDLIRIDHFRGLESAWVIDSACDTALDGRWEIMPGDELLSRISETTGDLPIVAEDLGIITEEVKLLRKKHHLPGMAVMQFGFDEHEDNPHKPKNIMDDSVVYTGTHDNDTTRGWFESLDDDARSYICHSLECKQEIVDSCNIVNKLISAAMYSKASMCIIPMQDLLCLDSSARMNTPGTTHGNWAWSFDWEQIEEKMTSTIKQLITESDRRVQHDV